MKLYSRSDLMGVGVPVDAGGCGMFHSRPVVDGAPAKIFELDCPLCTVALEHDVQWSKHHDDLPKTPDEQAVLDEEAKRGMIANKADLAAGIAEGIATGMSGMSTCRTCGKMNFGGAKFCGECGNQLGAPPSFGGTESHPEEQSKGGKTQAALKQRLEEDENADEADEGDEGDEGASLQSTNLRTLRKRARQAGLDDSGTKEEVIARLEAEEK